MAERINAWRVRTRWRRLVVVAIILALPVLLAADTPAGGDYEAVKRLKLPAKVVSLAKEFGSDVSRCGPAHALATIAREAAGMQS